MGSFVYKPRHVKKIDSASFDQQSRKSAYAFAQTDQRICYSLLAKYNILTCFLQNFNISSI